MQTRHRYLSETALVFFELTIGSEKGPNLEAS